MREFDLREIDASPASFWTRKYRVRLEAMLAALEALVPLGSTVLDLACAQGNLAILAGERGYRCVGLDLRLGFLTYGRKKEDVSAVRWVVADAMRPPIRPASVDAVVLGEVVEHVAEPGELLRIAYGLVRPGGALIVTTPNGACIRHWGLPAYEAARRDIESLRRRQFGPAGEDHLFALHPRELVELVPPGAQILAVVLVTSTLWNRVVSPFARSQTFSRMLESFSRLRPWRRWLCETLVLVLR